MYEVKYDAIVTVERGGKTKKQIALDFGIPTSTLSTWIKNSDEIKKKYLSFDLLILILHKLFCMLYYGVL
jgi:hypothetical protein